jgi:hypothetical protein
MNLLKRVRANRWHKFQRIFSKGIEKWWGIIFCVYLMISLNSPAFGLLNQSHPTGSEIQNATADLSIHQQ